MPLKSTLSPQRIFQLLALSMLLLLGTACSASESAQLISSDLSLDGNLQEAATASTINTSYSPTPAALGTIIQSSQVASTDLEAALIQVYQQANPSVVYIITPSGSGSGFIYSQEGYIVTNNHVVTGARSFEVVFSNGERQSARLVGADADSDLAVIQVEALPEEVSPLPLADPGDLQVGQLVVAIGNPFGEQGSMSLGIISGVGRSLPSQRTTTTGSTYTLPDVIQTDAPINPGNSGGPLLNLDGAVVGVNAAIASLTGTNSGVGFSIPVRAVQLIVPALIKDGSYDYPYIGISYDGEITLSDESVYGLEQTQGAYLLQIAASGPAAQAGLVAADPNTGRGGDLIVAIDGQAVLNAADLNSYLVFHTQVGQTIQVTVLRAGKQLTIPVTLASRP